MKKRNMFN